MRGEMATNAEVITEIKLLTKEVSSLVTKVEVHLVQAEQRQKDIDRIVKDLYCDNGKKAIVPFVRKLQEEVHTATENRNKITTTVIGGFILTLITNLLIHFDVFEKIFGVK